MFFSNKKYNELIHRLANIESQIRGSENSPALISNETSVNLSKTDKIKIAYALNLCTVSVSQIIQYNDLYIMEQEYDVILNNLNLQEFVKDESLLKVLRILLDTITFFRIQAKEKELIEKEYQHKLKNAIWNAVPNISVILTGGNPISMAIAAVTQVGIGYMNYRKCKSEYSVDKERQDWELQRSAIEQLHGLRLELFEAAWRLSDAYEFDDALRLTEKQINHYNTILSDPDTLRRFEKLESVSHIFEAFPPFWYYKGNAAREIFRDRDNYSEEIRNSFKEKALEAFRKFEEKHISFMREDVIAATCALEHISLLSIETDQEKIKELLERAKSLAGDNFDILQMCVLVYNALNLLPEAESTLKRLVNEDYNVSLNGLWLSRIYCIGNNRVDYDILEKRIGKQFIMPWQIDEDKAREEYLQSNKDDVEFRFGKFVVELINKSKNNLYKKCGCYINRNGYIEFKGELPNKIETFINTDVSHYLVDILNDTFNEIYTSPVFNEFPASQEIWREFLPKYASEINEKKDDLQAKIIALQSQLRSEPIRKLVFNKNCQENIQMYERIKRFFKEQIETFFAAIIEDISKKFKETIDEKTITSANLLTDNINLWYLNNNLQVPILQVSSSESSIVVSNKNVWFADCT